MKSESVNAGAGPGFIAGLVFGLVVMAIYLGGFPPSTWLQASSWRT